MCRKWRGRDLNPRVRKHTGCLVSCLGRTFQDQPLGPGLGTSPYNFQCLWDFLWFWINSRHFSADAKVQIAYLSDRFMPPVAVMQIENCLRQLSISFKLGEQEVLGDLLIQLRGLIKRYAVDDSTSTAEKLQFFFNILPRINDLVNQAKLVKIRSRLLLQVYHVILLISSLGRTNPGWRLLGGANILSSVLVGLPDWVPPIDVETLLKDRRFEEIHDYRYFLTISMGVYIECILTLESVEYSELLSWASSAFYYGMEYLKFLEQLDLEFLARHSDDPFIIFRQYLFPMWNQFVFMHNLLRIFGGRWPRLLSSAFGTAADGVLKYIQYLKRLFSKNFDQIERIATSMVLEEGPMDSPHIQRLRLLRGFLEVYEEEIHQYTDNSPVLDRLLRLLLEMLKKLEDIDGPFVVSSPFWNYYYDLFDLLLEIDCPKRIYHLVVDARDRMILLYYKNFRLEILKGLSLLKSETHGFLKVHLKYFPNEYIDILILESLHLFGNGDENAFLRTIEQIETIGSAKMVSPCIDLLRAYCVYLRTGDVMHYPPLFENPFDSNSWHFGYEVHGPLGVRRYYPFATRLLKIQGFPLTI